MAASARRKTHRYSTRARMGLGSALGDESYHRPERLRRRPLSRARGTGRLSGALPDKVAVHTNRGLDALIQDVIDGVADEPHVEPRVSRSVPAADRGDSRC